MTMYRPPVLSDVATHAVPSIARVSHQVNHKLRRIHVRCQPCPSNGRPSVHRYLGLIQPQQDVVQQSPQPGTNPCGGYRRSMEHVLLDGMVPCGETTTNTGGPASSPSTAVGGYPQYRACGPSGGHAGLP